MTRRAALRRLPPYFVLLDSNVWVAERMLHSAIGEALLFAVIEDRASILLPEIVGREVSPILLGLCKNALSSIETHRRLLSQFAEMRHSFLVPNEGALKDGIDKRWDQLKGLVTPVPFKFEHAQAALDRILLATPPCSKNNEQFRDCCIWEVALQAANDATVHLVTSDAAFYEKREQSRGLAKELKEEVAKLGITITLHSTIAEFLTSQNRGTVIADKDRIKNKIGEAVKPLAEKRLAYRDLPHSIGSISRSEIHGYTTPQPSQLAISFEVSFNLIDPEHQRSNSELSMKGTCSYDPSTKRIADISIREWIESVTGGMLITRYDSDLGNNYYRSIE